MHHARDVRSAVHAQPARFVPSDHARGPWDRAAMHGGPPAALMAGVMEALPTEAPMAIVRTHGRDLPAGAAAPRGGCGAHRARGPARADCSPQRSPTATPSSAARRRGACASPTSISATAAARAAVRRTGGLGRAHAGERRPGVSPHRDRDALRTRVHSSELGPATVWMRLTGPVVAGQTPTPLAARARRGRFWQRRIGGSAVGDEFLFINTDLTVYLHRQPEGEWICLDAEHRRRPPRCRRRAQPAV